MPCRVLQTLGNLADAQVALGEAALQAGRAAEGQAAFEAALQGYQASCAVSDSANGERHAGQAEAPSMSL